MQFYCHAIPKTYNDFVSNAMHFIIWRTKIKPRYDVTRRLSVQQGSMNRKVHFRRGYLLGSTTSDIEVVKRQLNDFVRLTDERVKQTIDIRRVSLWIIRGCKCATLRSVRAAVDDAGATYEQTMRHRIVVSSITRGLVNPCITWKPRESRESRYCSAQWNRHYVELSISWRAPPGCSNFNAGTSESRGNEIHHLTLFRSNTLDPGQAKLFLFPKWTRHLSHRSASPSGPRFFL